MYLVTTKTEKMWTRNGYEPYKVDTYTELEMIDTRFGRVKLEEKAFVEGKHKRYSQMTVEYLALTESAQEYVTMKQEEDPRFVLHYDPKRAWIDWKPVFTYRSGDMETFLFDVIDTAYGYRICRATKHDTTKFVKQFIKSGYTYTAHGVYESGRNRIKGTRIRLEMEKPSQDT